MFHVFKANKHTGAQLRRKHELVVQCDFKVFTENSFLSFMQLLHFSFHKHYLHNIIVYCMSFSFLMYSFSPNSTL